GFLISIFMRGIAKRLSILADNSLRLARRQPLNDRLAGDDELAIVDDTFHSMAAALQESAQRERAILENAVDVICSIDADGKFSEVNPACLTAWGYTQEELLGLRFIELVDANGKDYTLEQLASVRSGGHTIKYENQIVHKDGSVLDILWSASWS